MKFINLVFIFILTYYITFPLYSQEEQNDKQEETFRNIFEPSNSMLKKKTLRGMGELNIEYNSIKSLHGILNGVEGGVIINEELLIGIFANNTYTIENEIFNRGEGNEFKANYSSSCGGILTEYFFKFQSPINISIPLHLGIGIVKVDSSSTNHSFLNITNGSNTSEHTIEKSFMFILDPGISLNANISKFCIVSLGIKWRFSLLTDHLKYLSINDMSNISYGISLRFGNFGFPAKKY